jgi:HEAT repeat protein
LDRAFVAATEYWREVSQGDLEIIVNTLFRLDCDRAVTFLYNVMVELDPWSRAQMIDQIIGMPTQRAIDLIAQFKNDENEMVQEAALSALQSVGYPLDLAAPIDENQSLDSGAD